MKNGSKWPEVRIGDLGAVHTGRTPSTKRPEYFGETFPFITPGDMHQGKRVRVTSRSLSPDGARLLDRIRVPAKSVCVSCIGWQMGEVVMTSTDSFTNQQINTVVSNEKVDPDFLYYSLRPRKQKLLSLGSGIGVRTPILNKSEFSNLTVALPDLPTQRKIAGILSAYDDLIENNLRRIRILEEMAQSLYREWFVHFRFARDPSEASATEGGHQSTKMTDSPLGPIPEGWEVKSMPEAVEVRPKLPIPKDDEIPFIPMGSLSETSMLIGEVEIRAKASGSRFQNGDTLCARITPCLENGKTGFVQFLPDDDAICCCSTEFIVLRSKTVCPEYVYLMARSDPFRDNAIKSMSGATGRQRVRDECFDQFLLAQPPEDLLERFRSTTRPQFQLIRSLNVRNQTLRQTRDLLLPKLMSHN